MADQDNGAGGDPAGGDVGFTGVAWDERPVQQLAVDLHAGSGPVPQVEAGVAWMCAATELASVGSEYGAVLARLRGGWESSSADVALDRFTAIGEWLTEVAGAAATVSGRAHAHAAAVTVARLAMPAPVEIDAARAVREAATSQLATGAAALAPLIVGAAAQAERAQHDQQMRAGRVMAEYEAATAPMVAATWSPRAAPRVVPELAAPIAGPPSRESGTPTASPGVAISAAGLAGIAMPATRQLRYAPTVIASVAAATTPASSPEPVRTPQPGAAPPPMAPMAPAALMARDEVRATKPEDTSGAGSPSATEATDDQAPQTWLDVATASSPVPQGSPDRPLEAQFVMVPKVGGGSEI